MWNIMMVRKFEQYNTPPSDTQPSTFSIYLASRQLWRNVLYRAMMRMNRIMSVFLGFIMQWFYLIAVIIARTCCWEIVDVAGGVWLFEDGLKGWLVECGFMNLVFLVWMWIVWEFEEEVSRCFKIDWSFCCMEHCENSCNLYLSILNLFDSWLLTTYVIIKFILINLKANIIANQH